jgi:hypothetical protein
MKQPTMTKPMPKAATASKCKVCGKPGRHYVHASDNRVDGPYCARHAAAIGRK